MQTHKWGSRLGANLLGRGDENRDGVRLAGWASEDRNAGCLTQELDNP